MYGFDSTGARPDYNPGVEWLGQMACNKFEADLYFCNVRLVIAHSGEPTSGAPGL